MFFGAYSENVIHQEIRDNDVNHAVWIAGGRVLQMEDDGISLRSVVKRRNNAGRSKSCICLKTTVLRHFLTKGFLLYG